MVEKDPSYFAEHLASHYLGDDSYRKRTCNQDSSDQAMRSRVEFIESFAEVVIKAVSPDSALSLINNISNSYLKEQKKYKSGDPLNTIYRDVMVKIIELGTFPK